MSDPEFPVTPEDRAFDEELRRQMRQVRAASGTCPSIEKLAAFLAGELSPADAGEIQNHVNRCGFCHAHVFRMKGFEQAPAPGPRTAWLRSPWFAYALAAVLAVPAWRGLQPAPTATPPASPTAQTVQIVDLTSVRDATSLPAADGRNFALRFLLPIAPGTHIDAVIRDSTGAVRATLPNLMPSEGDDRFLVVCRFSAFPSGAYVIEVTERTGAKRAWKISFVR
jgi:hypothetical protein